METETGVPWLEDIPVLGFAFRTTSEQTMRRHLLIAVQAEILRPEARELAERLARELGPLDPAARAER
jgi:type II secretory pathway component GspD/PulD (secretin)